MSYDYKLTPEEGVWYYEDRIARRVIKIRGKTKQFSGAQVVNGLDELGRSYMLTMDQVYTTELECLIANIRSVFPQSLGELLDFIRTQMVKQNAKCYTTDISNEPAFANPRGHRSPLGLLVPSAGSTYYNKLNYKDLFCEASLPFWYKKYSWLKDGEGISTVFKRFASVMIAWESIHDNHNFSQWNKMMSDALADMDIADLFDTYAGITEDMNTAHQPETNSYQTVIDHKFNIGQTVYVVDKIRGTIQQVEITKISATIKEGGTWVQYTQRTPSGSTYNYTEQDMYGSIAEAGVKLEEEAQ